MKTVKLGDIAKYLSISTSRLLMKSGLPIAMLPVSRHLEYYEALDNAYCTGDYEPFVKQITEVVELSFEPYWWALGVGK